MPDFPLQVLFTAVILVANVLTIRKELKEPLPPYMISTARIRAWHIFFIQVVFLWALLLTWGGQWVHGYIPYFFPYSIGGFFVLSIVSSILMKRWMRCRSCNARVLRVPNVYLENEPRPKNAGQIDPMYLTDRCPHCGAGKLE